MTWRKARSATLRSAPPPAEVDRNNVPNECDLTKRNDEQQLENSRVRYPVVELIPSKDENRRKTAAGKWLEEL